MVSVALLVPDGEGRLLSAAYFFLGIMAPLFSAFMVRLSTTLIVSDQIPTIVNCCLSRLFLILGKPQYYYCCLSYYYFMVIPTVLLCICLMISFFASVGDDTFTHASGHGHPVLHHVSLHDGAWGSMGGLAPQNCAALSAHMVPSRYAHDHPICCWGGSEWCFFWIDARSTRLIKPKLVV